MNKKIKLGLALSGGASRGCCHIGVLKVLEEHGIKPYAVAGTSMGALVGGLYVCGMKPDEMIEEIKSFKQRDYFDINFFKAFRKGLLKGEKIRKYVELKTEGKNIEDSGIKFFTTCVDLLTGEYCVIKSGKFADAIYPSLAIPIVFSPFEMDGRLLVDGGLVDNIPDSVLKEIGCDVIISIDAIGEYKCEKVPKNTLRILENTIFLSVFQNQKRLARNSDLILVPEQDVKLYRFSQDEMMQSIEAGEKVTREHIDEIKKILG